MTKFKFILVLLIIPFLMMCGCQDNSVSYQMIQRDNYNTGGNLTFVYDKISHTASFGGDGETVQFYSQDIAKGWDEEGCRVGIQILIPKEVDDFKSGTAILGDEELTAEEFLVQTNDNTFNYAIFQPIVSEENREIDLKIIWQEGFKEQTYHIVIKEGTIFMDNK